MTRRKITGALLTSLLIMPLAQADSTLIYDFTSATGSKIQHTISISGRWLRLESEPRGNSDYTVMDTGRMLMFEVNDKDKNFQVTRMGRLFWPASASTAPQFKPIARKDAVAGVRCQPVEELGPKNKPIAQHCMSTGGALGLNAREMITLSRLFMSSRRLGLGWPGVATPDERQASVESQMTDGTKIMFRSVKHGRIQNTRLKIPVNYNRLKPDLPVKNNL